MKRVKAVATKLLIAVTMAFVMAMSVSAGETLPLSDYQPDAGVSNPIIIQPYDTVTKLASVSLTGLNRGKYYYDDNGFAGYSVPTNALALSTRLTTTGTTSSVRVGAGTMNWSTGELTPVAYTTMKLTDYRYATASFVSNKTYYCFITNNTNGVVKGSVIWYRLDSM